MASGRVREEEIGRALGLVASNRVDENGQDNLAAVIAMLQKGADDHFVKTVKDLAQLDREIEQGDAGLFFKVEFCRELLVDREVPAVS